MNRNEILIRIDYLEREIKEIEKDKLISREPQRSKYETLSVEEVEQIRILSRELFYLRNLVGFNKYKGYGKFSNTLTFSKGEPKTSGCKAKPNNWASWHEIKWC